MDGSRLLTKGHSLSLNYQLCDDKVKIVCDFVPYKVKFLAFFREVKFLA
jgi:hypothetical protein